MSVVPNSLEELIRQFSKLPGIGRKTAERLSLFILKANTDDVFEFSETLKKIKENIKTCKVCHCFVEDVCYICRDQLSSIVCVVEDATDVFLIDKSGFKGKFHVLGGLISPLDGVAPDHLNFDTLLNRLDGVEEVVVAVDPSSEGDITNLYLSELLQNHEIKLSRLARGVPIGSSLEFIDQVTLTHSMNDRVQIK